MTEQDLRLEALTQAQMGVWSLYYIRHKVTASKCDNDDMAGFANGDTDSTLIAYGKMPSVDAREHDVIAKNVTELLKQKLNTARFRVTATRSGLDVRIYIKDTKEDTTMANHETQRTEAITDRTTNNTREQRTAAIKTVQDWAAEFFTKHDCRVREWTESETVRERFLNAERHRAYVAAVTLTDDSPLTLQQVRTAMKSCHDSLRGYLPIIEIRDSHIRVGLKRE